VAAARDVLLDVEVGDDLGHRAAQLGHDLQQQRDEVVRLRRVVGRERREGARGDLERELRQVLRVEGELVGRHAVEDDSQRPHVALVRVRCALHDLG
jgi:hypothetical protein